MEKKIFVTSLLPDWLVRNTFLGKTETTVSLGVNLPFQTVSSRYVDANHTSLISSENQIKTFILSLVFHGIFNVFQLFSILMTCISWKISPEVLSDVAFFLKKKKTMLFSLQI